MPDRGVTGTALLADTLRHRLLHINGVEQSGDWQNLSLVMRESTDGGRHWSPARLIAPQHTLRHQAMA
ncbi:MAG: glycoside hydrolase, partial [Bacteroidales bacterium]|nr:glycoside hydrolase [Candidatus Equimonas enterica]